MVVRTSFLIAMMALSFSGCGKKGEEKIAENIVKKAIEKESGGKADVDISNGNVNIKTDDGEMSVTSGKNARIPEAFPTDILIYQGSSVEAAMEVPEGYSVQLKSDDDVTKIAETYKADMKAQGWSQEASLDMGEQAMLSFKKGERAAQVVIMPDESITRIGLTTSK
ncbi:MAG: hypothetical protein GF401_12300 [Chitinivibrionales bacterium]|nr:hypothetical protein [Chitinivibrionales bacterium]